MYHVIILQVIKNIKNVSGCRDTRTAKSKETRGMIEQGPYLQRLQSHPRLRDETDPVCWYRIETSTSRATHREGGGATVEHRTAWTPHPASPCGHCLLHVSSISHCGVGMNTELFASTLLRLSLWSVLIREHSFVTPKTSPRTIQED